MSRAGMRRAALFATSLAATTVAGCSDPKAASEANFTRALQPLVENAFCHEVPAQLMTTAVDKSGETPPPLPLMIPTTPLTSAGPQDAAGRAMLESAAQEGLLKRTTTTAPARRWLGSEPLEPMALIVFTPTGAGKNIFRGVEEQAADHQMHVYPEICLGRGKIDQVMRWTDPADMFGRTISQVTYTYSATDLPAGTPADVVAEAAKPKTATRTLMRTSDGWQLAE